MEKFKTRTRQILGVYLYKSAYHRAFFSMLGIVIKEIRCVFRQFFTWKHPVFSVYRITAIVISSLTRLLLGRSVKYSFSFTGEDRMIESMLKPLITNTGFYVDVGCNHPVFLSNTYSLYRKGWRGVCIDANPTLIEKYAIYRPKDKAICTLISNVAQETTFYMVQNDVLSTTQINIAEEYKKQGLTVKETKTKSETLTEVLNRQNAPRQIDLLTIDAEDYDFQVLNSLDFSLYKPNLIVVEDDQFDTNKPNENKFCIFLFKKGYELKAFALDNLYFIRP